MTNSEKFERRLKFWIILFFLIGLLGWYLGSNYLNIKFLNSKLTGGLKPTGYPASEEQIVGGKFYYCNASIVKIYPNRTNLFVVLQEMTPNGSRWQTTDINRLFKLGIERYIEVNAIYEASRKGSGLVFKKVAAVRQ